MAVPGTVREKTAPCSDIGAKTPAAAVSYSANPCALLPMNLQLFAHIHADAFIQQSLLEHLEDYTVQGAIDYLRISLQNIAHLLSEKDKAQVTEILALFNSIVAEVSAEDCIQMKPRQKILMLGGWGKSFLKDDKYTKGHALLYLLEKREDGKFNVTVFNTGPGVNYYKNHQYEELSVGRQVQEPGDSLQISPVQKYIEVSQESLSVFLRKAAILRKDNWPSYWPEKDRKESIGSDTPENARPVQGNEEQYLYGIFFSKWKRDKTAASLLMKEPRSDTFAYRTPLALIKSYLSPEGYKLFKYYSKRDAFLQFYEKCKKEGKLKDPEVVLLLREAGEKLLRQMAKLFVPVAGHEPQSLLAYEEAKQGHDQISSIVDELKHSVETAPVQSSKRQVEVQAFTRNTTFNREGFFPEDVHISPSSEAVTPYESATRENFLQRLQATLARVKSISDNEIIAFEIERLVSSLPLPDTDFWKTLPSDKITEIFDSLYSLMICYFKASQGKLHSIIEKQNVILGLLASTYAIALSKDANLAQYGLSVDFLNSALQSPGLFVCFDKEAFDRREKLLAFLQGKDRAKERFSFCSLNKGDYSLGRFQGDWRANYAVYLEKAIQSDGFKNEVDIKSEPAIQAWTRNNFQNRDWVPSRFRDDARILLADDDVLKRNKLQHVVFLRNAEGLARLFCENPQFTKFEDLRNKQVIASRYDIWSSCSFCIGTKEQCYDYSYNCYISKITPLHNFRSTEPDDSLLLHRQGGMVPISAMMQQKEGDRGLFVPNSGFSEGEARTTGAPCSRMERDLASAAVCPSIRPSEVLDYFLSRFHTLSDAEQTLFDGLLFRPHLEDGSWKMAICEEAQKEAFLKQCRQFISEGLDYCLKRHAGKIDVHKALFFIRFYDRIRKMNKEAALPDADVEKAIDALLALSYTTESEKRAIHLQRIFHYSIFPQERLTNDILKKIVFSWFYFNKCSADPVWDDLYLFWTVRRFIISLSPLLQARMEAKDGFKESVLNEIWERVLGERASADAWEGVFPLFTRQGFKLNVLNTQIHVQKGDRVAIIAPPFGIIDPSDRHYQKLFKGELFDLQPTEGGFFSFKHSKYGLMRLRKLTPKSPLEIYKKVGDHWCKYCDPSELFTANPPVLPFLFSGKEYACFLDVEEAKQDHFKLYVEPLELGAPYLLEIQKDKTSGNFQTNFFEIDEKGAKKNEIMPCSLPNFDPQRFSGLALLDQNGRKLQQKFLRYRSVATKQTLAFCGATLQWEENRAFELQNEMRTGLLGKVSSNYLLLKDPKTGREKILVPMQRIVSNQDKKHTDEHELDVGDGYKRAVDREIAPFLREQIGVHSFLEFDVKGDTIEPLSIEGSLYKAYLALAQRNYVEAKRLLEEIPEGERSSPESLKILNWIINEGRDAVDYSASAAIVRLSAIFLFCKLKGLETLDAGLTDVAAYEIQQYQKSRNNALIEVELRPEEIDFFEKKRLKIEAPNSARLTRYTSERLPVDDKKLELKNVDPKSVQFFSDYVATTFESGVAAKTWTFPPIDKESVYAASLKREHDDFKTDYQAGVKKNAEAPKHTLKSDKNFEELKKKVQQEQRQQKVALDKEKDGLVKFANKRSSDERVALHNELLKDGKRLAPLKINDLVNLFLLGDFEAYERACPYLTAMEIKQLDQDIQAFLLNAIKFQKLTRAAAFDSEKDKDNLARELETELATNSNTRDLLVYQYKAGIILRQEQADDIAKMLATTEDGHLKNLTLQMMMGGGKTSVLAAIWLYKASHVKGRLAVFVPPAAQFETLRANLGRSQKRNFNQVMLPVKLSREELELDALRKLESDIENAKKTQGFVMITKETLQTLELELLYILDHYSENVTKTANESKEKVRCLQRILKQFRENADFLIDESDILLSPNLEVNLPVAKPSTLQYEFVTAIEAIYKLHISKQKYRAKQEKYREYDGKSIEEIIGLARNEQHTLDIEFYKEELQPLIARELLKTASFQEIPHEASLDYTEPFVRYVCGQMNSKNKTPQDQEFLDYLQRLAKSGNKEDNFLADEVALAKFFFVKILPFTLTKNTGKAYGRSPQHSNGKIVPFSGVDTPSPTTEFGSPWVAAAYHFQTVLSSGISISQVRSMVERAANMAEHEARKKGCAIEETDAAKRFSKATTIKGVSEGRNIASIAGDDAEIEKLWRELNDAQDMDVRLAFEREIIVDVVQYYASYFGSTAQDFVLQCSTVRTFSGTPWNYHCYGAGLDKRENLALEEGVEGSIVDKMLQKSAGKQLVHAVQKVTVENVLQSVTTNGGKKAQSLIDAGGIFKDFDNVTVAREIAKHFANDEKIEYVLFFGRGEKSEATPNHVMYFKRGVPDPIYIGSTNIEELQKRGITRQNVFVYFDEKHCEATDLPLGKESLGIVAMSGRMDLRTELQSIMRLREFFKEQDVEYVIPSVEKRLFLNEGKTLEDCILTFLTNQGERKADQAYQSARQRIKAFIRKMAVRGLLEADGDIFDLYNSKYHKVFKTTLPDSPYLDYGPLDEEVDSRDALISCAEAELKKCDFLTQSEKAEIWQGVQHLIAEEVAKQRLPGRVLSNNFNGDLQVAMERETDVVLETELDEELARYMVKGTLPLFKEKVWQKDRLDQDLKLYDKLDVPRIPEWQYPLVFCLKNLLTGGFKYDHSYAKIFASNIEVTNNFAFTYSTLAPVFDSSQKRAQHVLVIRESSGKLRYILLSAQDADFFKRHIESTACTNMWLYFADKTLVSANPEPMLSEAELQERDRMFVQINILAGNADYLDSHEKEFKAFLKSLDSEAEDLLIRFLKLKVEKNKSQRGIFYNSLIKCFSHWAEQIKLSDLYEIPPEKIPEVPSRFYKHLKRKEQIQSVPLDRVDALSEDPEQLRHLTDGQIKALKKPQLINALNNEQLNLISEEQIKKLTEKRLNNIPEDADCFYRIMNNLSPEQFKLLKGKKVEKIPLPKVDDLTPEQVQYFTDDQIRALEKEELINAVETKRLGLLNTNQLQKLNEKRVNDVKAERLNELTPKQREKLNQNKINECPFELLTNLQFQQLLQARVATIPPEHVLKLTREQLKWLTTSEQVEKVVGDERLRYLTKEQLQMRAEVSDIPDDILDRLSPAQVQRLENVAKINKLPKAQLAFLLPGQLNSLGSVRAKDIPPEKVQDLDDNHIKMLEASEQINEVPVVKVPLLSPKQMQQLTNVGIIAGLEKYKLNQLSPAGVNQVPDNRLVDLDEPHIRMLTDPAKINVVPDDQVKFLSETQVPLLTDSHRIGLLKGEQVTHVASDYLKHVSDDELGNLKPDQLNNLDENKLNKVPDNRLGELDDVHIQMLTDPVKINAVPDGELKRLKLAQIKYLTPEKMKKLPPEKLGDLDAERIQGLTEAAQINSVPDDKVQFLSETQIPLLTDIHKIGLLKDKQVQYVAPANLKYVADGELGNLSAEQLNKLESEQINKTPPERFKDLDRDHVRMLKGEAKINAVPDEKIPDLSETQVPLLTDAHKIGLLKGDQVKHVAPENLEHVSDDELGNLNPDQLNKTGLARVGKIPPACIQYLDKMHVQMLSKEAQISSISEKQISFLSPMQVAKLTNAKIVELLSDDEQISHVSLDMVNNVSGANLSKLTPEQLNHLNADKVNQVPDNRLGNLDDAHIKMLKEQAKINAVPENRLSALSKKQIALLTNPDKIKVLSPVQLNSLGMTGVRHVLPEQVVDLDDKHIRMLRKTEQINAVPVNRLGVLLNKQVALLTDSAKIEKLSSEQVKHLNSEYVNHVSNDNLGGLRKKQLKYLNKAKTNQLPIGRIADLDDAHIKLLDNSERINAVPITKLGILEPGQIALLTDSDKIAIIAADRARVLGDIPARVVEDYSRRTYAAPADAAAELPDDRFALRHGAERVMKDFSGQTDAVPGSAAAELSGERLALHRDTERVMKDFSGQTDAVPGSAAAELSSERLALHRDTERVVEDFSGQTDAVPGSDAAELSDEQLEVLSDVETIKHLSGEKLNKLGKNGINNVPEERLGELDDVHIKMLEGTDRVNAVPEGKVNELSDEQLKLLSDAKKIKRLDNVKLRHLSEAALKCLSKEQKRYVKKLSDEEALNSNSITLLKAKYARGFVLRISLIARRIFGIIQRVFFFFTTKEKIERTRASVQIKHQILQKLRRKDDAVK